MNNSRHTSLGQTMAQMRRRYQTRSSGGSGTPYTPSGMPPVAIVEGDQVVALKTMDDPATGTTTTKATANFNGSKSHDPDDGTSPGQGIIKYSWSFPGGNPESFESKIGSPEFTSSASTTYTTPGEKTVTLTVTDNDDPAETNTTTFTATVAKITPVLTPKDNFAGRSNSRFGRREPITLSYTIEPSGVTAADLGGLKWEIEPGDGTLTPIRKKPGHYPYIAPDTPGNVTLKLKIESGPSAGVVQTQEIKVVKPKGRLVKAPNTQIGHLHNVFSVGFTAKIYLDPKDVSFSHLSFREQKAKPHVIEGYFLRNTPPHQRNHRLGEWHKIGPGNIKTGCEAAVDRVGTKIKARDWSPGELIWIIPWEVGWQVQKKGDDGVIRIRMETLEIQEVWQRAYAADVRGTAAIQKGGVGPFSAPLLAPTVRPDDDWRLW